MTTNTEPHYERTEPVRSGIALINWHLENNQLGGLHLDFTKAPQDIPEGRGWCRAQPLPEELWPAHADLAVVVRFTPAPLFRRDARTGRVPANAVQHWMERLDACADALADQGFVVEEWGVPKMPDLHAGADLVVYRLPVGITPAPRPPVDLRYGRPPRPNFKERGSPTELWKVDCVLADADPPLYRYDERQGNAATGAGRCLVRSVDENLWPPGATDCVLAIWEPDPVYRRDPSRPTMQPGTYAHWARGIAHLGRTLMSAGYQIRRRQRPTSPRTDGSSAFLACRSIPEGTPPSPVSGGRPATRPRWRPGLLASHQETIP